MLLIRIGLIVGFIGSLFLSIGILGAERVRGIEKFTQRIVDMLIKPRKLFNFLVSDNPSRIASYSIGIIYIASAILSMLTFDLFKSVSLLKNIYLFQKWAWGLPIWLSALLMMISFLFLIVYLGVFVQIKARNLPVKRYYKSISAILVLICLIILLPIIPVLILWIICIIIVIYIISNLVWVLSFPIQFGFKIQKKYEINGAYEIAGLLLLALAFIMQLISTF